MTVGQSVRQTRQSDAVVHMRACVAASSVSIDVTKDKGLVYGESKEAAVEGGWRANNLQVSGTHIF